MTESNKAVFLSYASEDSAAAARICAALRAAGIEVWFDQSELRGGEAWDAAIRKQVKTCALFIPVISRNTHTRDEGYFRFEWKLAVDRSYMMTTNKAFLLPVVIDDTRDDDEQVPDKFREVHWMRLLGGESAPAFVEHVARLLSPDHHGAAAPALPPAASAVPVTGPMRTSVAGGPARGSASSLEAVLPARAAIPDKSIAVLPFADMSAKKDQEYFSDGLAEALIDLLAQGRDLRVPARTSSFYFKGKQVTVAEVATMLGVAHVLEGSVRKAGRTIRVTAHLIRADDGYHVWSKTYDRDLKDIFKVQDEIASVVVDALKAELLPAHGTVNQHRTANTEAYEQYLLGRLLYNRGSAESFLRAVATLRQAIALDPNYASAHALLAVVECRLAEQSSHSAETDAEAIAAADRAVALAPDLAETYAARGFVRLRIQWDWSGAQADLEKAMQLDPRDSASPRRYSLLLLALGRFPAAIAPAQMAIEREPLEMNNWIIYGFCLSGLGQYAAGHRALTRALELSPESYQARAWLGQIELLEGRAEEALQTSSQQQIGQWRWNGVAKAEHTLGHAAASQQALDELIASHGRDWPTGVAEVYAWRSEPGMALDWLERAYRQHDQYLCFINFDLSFLSLRSEPRYQVLLRQMNLPERASPAPHSGSR